MVCAVVNLLAQERLCGASLGRGQPCGFTQAQWRGPTAVGEILRRLTSKCLMATVRADARSFFRGTSSVRHPSSSSNWISQIHRSAILPTVRAKFPALARWTTWCYRQPTRLQFANHALGSQSGVQQGDPLGAIAFSRCLAAVSFRVRVGYCGTLLA